MVIAKVLLAPKVGTAPLPVVIIAYWYVPLPPWAVTVKLPSLQVTLVVAAVAVNCSFIVTVCCVPEHPPPSITSTV